MNWIAIYTLTALAALSTCCPHALDWEKRTAEERAAKSDIVVVGYVTRSYKHLADPDSTNYAVEFKIIRTLKGHSQILTVPHDSALESGVYNITNFGSMLMCFADIGMEHVYMLFLQVVGDHLSAHYTDLFGAAEVWTMQMEDNVILTNLGYASWSEWSACTTSCGHEGVQIRNRKCSRETLDKCAGDNQEKRRCNQLDCDSVKDITKLAGFDDMTRGVIALNVSGKPIYDITANFYAQVSGPRLFSPLWPDKFTVMGRIRPRRTKYPREGQYLFSLSDSSGRMYLGLKAYPSPTLEVLHSNGKHSRVSIPLSQQNINDGQWHQFAFGVNGPNISMYYNCYETTSQVLPTKLYIPNVYKSTMILGSRMFAMDRGADERYEGALTQLVITGDWKDAEKQCNSKAFSEMALHKEGTAPRRNSADVTQTANYLEHWEWSTWSECSASCGFGVKVRTPFCLDDNINLEDCIPYYVPKTHEKQCYEGVCPVCDECDNGGQCVGNGICQCKPGWSGKSCRAPVCEDGCKKGECVSPGNCRCDSGWSGAICDIPMCFPSCANGGTCLGSNQCHCPPGIGGRFCTEHSGSKGGTCKKKCRNGGRCVGDNKCECPAGWRGSRCHKRAPICPGGCANGGKCRKGNVCKCKKGFKGKNCESDVCGNCRNGGRCERRKKECKCSPGFAGQLCEYEVNESLCAKNPCQNVGSCVAYDTCYCPRGWFGLRCEYRQCAKYKITTVTEMKTVRIPKMKLVDCNTSATGKCQVIDRFVEQLKEVMRSVPDYTQCDEGEKG